jgi:lipopolysaccharide/colanic/teichoic acid biosynthesis glycosyltransferase
MDSAMAHRQEPVEGRPLAAVEAAPSAGRRRRLAMLDWAAKQLLDVTLAALGLLVLAPLLAAIAVAIRLTSPGHAVFRQVRVGYRETPFVIWKFRTMYRDNDDAVHRDYVATMLTGAAEVADNGRGIYKLTGDPRVTPLGRLLRKTSLDELPQLVNVVRGEMSLVGPRPVLPWEAELFEPRHRLRFAVKPGMTGLWQVSGRSDLSWEESIRLDLYYVENWSWVLDALILARTVPAVFKGRGAY